MKTFLTTAAIGAMLTAGAAIATQTQAPAAPKPPASKAEAVARADARFDRLDTNKDGQLSAAEIKAGADAARAAMAGKKGGELRDFVPGGRGGGMGERVMARFDTNGDGMISKAEHRAIAEARFDRMQAGEGRKGMGKRGEGRGGKRMGMRGGHGGGLMKADADKDGVVTRAEYDALSAQRFAKLDANRDGKIDAAEMQVQRDKAREAMKKMRAHRGQTPPPPPSPRGE